MARALVLVGIALVIGCGDDDAGGMGEPIDDGRAECENLNPNHCLLPWPSSRYLVDDAATATGRRIEIPIEAMPANQYRDRVDPAMLERFDGFSPMTSMMTLFLGQLDASSLPDAEHVAASLDMASPTVVLDAETGERVPHFAEIDQWPLTRPARASFYIRPAQRLKENHRYVVAIRDLSLTDGSAVEPSPYFRALRDETPTESSELEARRAHFDDVFALLAAAGVPRETLVEAWDFHTASGETAYRDLLHMRDDAMMRIGERGLGCTITTVEEPADDPNLWRRIEGTFTAPLYMDDPEPGGRLVRDAGGLPTATGTVEVPFLAIIPKSVQQRVMEGRDPARLMTYGHGLFGSRGELGGRFGREFTNRTEIVGVATDWWGMSEADVPTAGEILGEMSRFPELTDRMHQGLINFLVLTRSMAGVCSELPEFTVATMPTATSVIDPNERYYLGISQGGIFGGTIAGISTDITRLVLQVGGISYPIMLKRSIDFGPYAALLNSWYRDTIDQDILMVLAASQWDLVEPSTYLPRSIASPLPGTPPKNILYPIARHDSQVSNVASEIAARSMGIPMLVPSVYEPWGIETSTGPEPSAMVVYDVGVEALPVGTVSPGPDNGAHGEIRFLPALQTQMDEFMRPDGVVRHTCDQACDPE